MGDDREKQRSKELQEPKSQSEGTNSLLSSDAKDLGRKARERLEMERNKRREIVRLSDQPSTKDAIKDIIPRDPAKKRRSTPSYRHGIAKRKSIERGQMSKVQGFDLDYPDISKIPEVQGELRSNVVRLHGLPIDVRPDDIRRFFSGLETERILVLPELDVIINEWDATTTYASRDSKYYKDCSLRVFVKFSTAPVAFLAVQRSGEVLTMKGALGESVRACIKVTTVSKTAAPYILRRMGVDGEDGIPIRTRLADVEKKLHPLVNPIIWTSLLDKLFLTTDEKRDSKKAAFNLRLKDPINLTTLQGYQQLASHHNKLADNYESLVGPTLLPLTYEHDAEFSRDPVVRLTCQASNILLVEMRRIQQLLFQARLGRQLQKLQTA